MEFDHEEEALEPVSPTAQFFKSSSLSVTIFGVLELERLIEDDISLAFQQLNDVFLPINPRFSSIMITEKDGEKKWKRVQVNVEDHVKFPVFPEGKTLEYYDETLKNYLEKIAMEDLPHDRPLWELHIFNYPTSNAAANIVFKLHHSLGDGYSLMGALLSCLQRVDNPSLPLTFPSRESKTNSSALYCKRNGILSSVPRFFSMIFNTVRDFGFSILKTTLLQDEYSPIRSSEEGIEFRQITMADMTISLDRIKQVSTKLKVTVNDVIAGVMNYGTRMYMEEMDHKSRMSNTSGLVVLNTRAIGGYKSVSEMIKPNAEMPWGNRVAFLHFKLPKLNASMASDPLHFVMDARRTILRKRNSAAAYLTAALLDIIRKVRGPEVASRYFFDTIRNTSMGMTNLIGPVEKIALAGYPVKGIYFFVSGVPLNIVCTIISYAGTVKICFIVEKDFIDPRKLKSSVENAFDKIFRAAINYKL